MSYTSTKNHGIDSMLTSPFSKHKTSCFVRLAMRADCLVGFFSIFAPLAFEIVGF